MKFKKTIFMLMLVSVFSFCCLTSCSTTYTMGTKKITEETKHYREVPLAKSGKTFNLPNDIPNFSVDYLHNSKAVPLVQKKDNVSFMVVYSEDSNIRNKNVTRYFLVFGYNRTSKTIKLLALNVDNPGDKQDMFWYYDNTGIPRSCDGNKVGKVINEYVSGNHAGISK